MTKKQKLARVLALVNEARKAIGMKALKKLPKGKQNECRHCPIAKSFPKSKVGSTVITFSSKRVAKRIGDAWEKVYYYYICFLPDEIEEFVEDFNSGKYPELILK